MKYKLLLLFFLFSINTISGQTPDISRLYKIEILIRYPYLIDFFPASPGSYSDESDLMIYKLSLKSLGDNTNSMMGNMYDSLLICPDHIKTGACIDNQASNGFILIRFYFRTSKTNIFEIQSIFINRRGFYLLNEEEDEYFANPVIASYIKNNFKIISDAIQ